MSARSKAPPRDIDLTGFTLHLEALLGQVPEALCAVFVDSEGETIDLATRIDPFDTRIAGAEMAIVLQSLRASCKRAGAGPAVELRVECEDRCLLARNVAEGVDLVLVVEGNYLAPETIDALAGASMELLRESGLPPPSTVMVLRPNQPPQRASRPAWAIPTVVDEDGERHVVDAILGWRQETDRIDYLVRLDSGEELIVTRDPKSGQYRRA